MITINLLPGEFKKKKVEKSKPEDKKADKKRAEEPKRAFKFETVKFDKVLTFSPKLFKIGGVVLAVLIGFHLLLGVLLFSEAKALKQLDSQWQPLQPKKLELEKTNSESISIEKLTTPISQLVEARLMWSKKLNELSDLMTPGIWLTRLSVEKQFEEKAAGEFKKVLKLEGCAFSSSEDETSLIGKFIKVLQEDKNFSFDFSQIKLGPIEKAMIEKNTVMNFKVFCVIKKN